MSYDPTFRERAVRYRESHSRQETRDAFGISGHAIDTWLKKYLETGCLKDKPLERKHRKIDPELLRKDAHDNPDAFNWERAGRFGRAAEAISKALKRLGAARKKTRGLQGKIGGETALVPQ